MGTLEEIIRDIRSTGAKMLFRYRRHVFDA